MSKHTPAPWTLGSLSGIKSPDGKWVGEPCQNVYAPDETPSRGPSSICTARAANARLIAAAPEMLDALKTCLEFVDSGGLSECVNAHAKCILEQYLAKAIAKATGGTK